MQDSITGGIGREIAFGDIRLMLRIVDQDSVPRLVLGRVALGHLLVPFLRAEKDRIDIVDDPAIAKQSVADGLPDRKLGFGVRQFSSA